MIERKPSKTDDAASQPARPIRRRDATGHLDPEYAATLASQSERVTARDNDDAFIRASRTDDPLAEELGEGFVRAATSGEDTLEILEEELVPEELGGPFIETPAAAEFASGTDASNPASAEREPFPKT